MTRVPPDTAAPRQSTARTPARILGVVGALCFGVVCATVVGELLSWGYFKTLGGDLGRPVLDGQIGAYDARLGYHLVPNATARFYGPEFDTTVRINDHGLRQAQTLPYERTPGKMRVLLAGDSFTFGHGVNDGERFGEHLSARLPTLEVVNMGVSGTGTDQQYLLYESEGVKYSPDLVVLSFMVENVRRNGSNARLGRDGEMLPKPQFILQHGELVLTNVPVPRETKPASAERLALEDLRSTGLPIPFKRLLQEHSYLYQFMRLRLGAPLKQLLRANPNPYPEYDPARAEWQVTAALIEKFAREAHAHGSEFLFVIIPSGEYIAMPWLDDRPYRMLNELCRTHHLDCLDLRPGILAASANGGERLYFPLDGHWTRTGHMVVANLIGEHLASRFGDVLLARHATQSRPDDPDDLTHRTVPHP